MTCQQQMVYSCEMVNQIHLICVRVNEINAGIVLWWEGVLCENNAGTQNLRTCNISNGKRCACQSHEIYTYYWATLHSLHAIYVCPSARWSAQCPRQLLLQFDVLPLIIISHCSDYRPTLFCYVAVVSRKYCLLITVSLWLAGWLWNWYSELNNFYFFIIPLWIYVFKWIC